MVRFVSETYLAGVSRYEMKMFFDNETNNVLSVKKIVKIDKPFTLNEDGHLIKILDDGYFVVEIVPLGENYVARVHFDEKGKLIEWFFTMTGGNEMKEGVPAYEDLKLSYVCTNFGRKVYNQERFDAFLQNGQISKETHTNILGKFDALKNSIDCEKNEIYNSCYEKYLF